MQLEPDAGCTRLQVFCAGFWKSLCNIIPVTCLHVRQSVCQSIFWCPFVTTHSATHWLSDLGSGTRISGYLVSQQRKQSTQSCESNLDVDIDFLETFETLSWQLTQHDHAWLSIYSCLSIIIYLFFALLAASPGESNCRWQRRCYNIIWIHECSSSGSLQLLFSQGPWIGSERSDLKNKACITKR